MRLKDRLYMDPIKKYENYGIFPWKLILGTLLVLFTTCQVVLIINKMTKYSYSQYILFNHIFCNTESEGQDKKIIDSYNIFKANDTFEYIKETVNKYYSINNYTVSSYQYQYLDDGTIEPPKLYPRYLENKASLSKGYFLEYSLDVEGLLSFPEIDSFLNEVEELEIEFYLKHELNKDSDLHESCYLWKFVQIYQYHYHGVITVSLDISRKSCNYASSCII
jgi:hypothetical protein